MDGNDADGTLKVSSVKRRRRDLTTIVVGSVRSVRGSLSVWEGGFKHCPHSPRHDQRKRNTPHPQKKKGKSDDRIFLGGHPSKVNVSTAGQKFPQNTTGSSGIRSVASYSGTGSPRTSAGRTAEVQAGFDMAVPPKHEEDNIGGNSKDDQTRWSEHPQRSRRYYDQIRLLAG